MDTLVRLCIGAHSVSFPSAAALTAALGDEHLHPRRQHRIQSTPRQVHDEKFQECHRPQGQPPLCRANLWRNGVIRSSTTSHPDAISSRLLGPTFSRIILRRPHRSCLRLGKRTRPEVSSDRARRASYQRQQRSMMNQSSRQSLKSQGSAVSSSTKESQCQSPNYQPLFWSTAACRYWSGASRSG